MSYRSSKLTRDVRIYKNECALCFATPESPDGLFFNLMTMQSYCLQHVKPDFAKTQALYLHERWTYTPPASDAPPPKKLAIGVQGGFQDDFERVVKSYQLASGPDFTLFTDISVAPPKVKALIDDVIAREDATRETAILAWEASTELKPSKYASALVQLNNNVRISADPRTWVCAESGLAENLWLNLSTGYIGSGRRNWDGSGGTGAALKHYEDTGRKYPLAVKLGTITPDGKADVYSYAPDEDCLVLDPLLSQHLAHFGIRVGDLLKTDKTMAELEVSLNESHDWTRIAEGGKELATVRGPLRVGLENLGNSCYCNAVLQLLFSLEPWRTAYAGVAPPALPQDSLGFQLCKLGRAMTAPETVLRPVLPPRHRQQASDFVSPRVLKTLLGQGHPDFSNSEQQDAALYLRHVLDSCSRDARAHGREDPQQWYTFALETRSECLQSQTVKYQEAKETLLELTVPRTTGSVVPFEACVKATLGGDAVETVENYLSPVTKTRGLMLKQQSLATLPRFLVVVLKKFVAPEGSWQPTKLDVSVPLPAEFDFGPFVGKGLQPGEVEMTEAEKRSPEPDAGLVAELVQMGFSSQASSKACVKTGNRSQEEAVNWIMEHLEDADLNEAPATAAAAAVDEAAVGPLMDMGFARDAAVLALRETGNSLDRAADWLFSRSPEEIAAALGAAVAAPAAAQVRQPVGSTRFHLKAVISHVGKTANSGHYVAHIKQGTEWVFFNDDKVVLADNPPLDLGYVLLWERV